MEKVKPCPFCKELRLAHNRASVGHLHWVYCHTCKTDGPVGIDRDEAVSLWNLPDRTVWQPIAIAPKNKRILLYYPECVFTGMHIIFGKWKEDTVRGVPRNYWTNDFEHLRGINLTVGNQPTMWMDAPNHPEGHV